MTTRLLSLFLLLFSFSCLADNTIKLGMSAAFTGPSAALGNQMKLGLETYFNALNMQGGVAGKKLELISLDDGYEPERAAKNVRHLIDKERVVALIGNVGTPTAVVTVPIVDQKQTLLFGAFTGANMLRPFPPSRYVINYRPSYAKETEKIINGLFDLGIKAKEIAFFTQRDSYGDAGYQGSKQALIKRGVKNVSQLAHGRYTRNSLNVEDAVATILSAKVDPKAIIMAGSYEASAKFIELIRRDLPNVMFFNLSFVGTNSLQAAISSDIDNVYVSQVVPHLNSDESIVLKYLTDLAEYSDQKPSYVSLEGYIVAALFHQGLLKVKGEINRQTIIDGLHKLNEIDIGLGVDLSLAFDDHEASDTLWLTHINKGLLQTVDWQQLSQRIEH